MAECRCLLYRFELSTMVDLLEKHKESIDGSGNRITVNKAIKRAKKILRLDMPEVFRG